MKHIFIQLLITGNRLGFTMGFIYNLSSIYDI